LRELLDAGLELDGVVLWLDDLDRYLSGDNWLDPGLLDQVVSAGAVVVATVRQNALESYRPTDKEHPPQWETVSRFARVELPRLFSSAERERVEVQIPDVAVRAAERYGLPEYLGGGPDAVDAFDAGETQCPVGAALVRAAVDWRRAGVVRLVRLADLTSALPIYLAERHDVAIDDASVKLGVEWATKKINETVRLLSPRYSHPAASDGAEATGMGGDSSDSLFEAFDYLVDVLVERVRSDDTTKRDKAVVPLAMWRLVAQVTTQAEQNDVRLAARSYVAGRSRVLADVSAWLAAEPTTPPQLLAIIGMPGSGKSAVIRQLAFLADPATRDLVPVDSRTPLLNLPAVDLITSARRTSGELMADICEAAGVPHDHARDERWRAGALLDTLAVRDRPLTVLIDAVDEAADPHETARLLADLVLRARGMPLRVLISTRVNQDVLPVLHDSQVIDLDDPQYADRDALVAFARLQLMTAPEPPSTNAEVVDRLAEEIAHRSEGSFLMAKLLCDALAAGTLDPADLISQEGTLPTDIDEIVRRLMASFGAASLMLSHCLLLLRSAQHWGCLRMTGSRRRRG
jgi:hypothetical protein